MLLSAIVCAQRLALLVNSFINCFKAPCVPTPELTTCVDFEAASPTEQTAICYSCSQGDIPETIQQLCDCCPSPTADPGVAPVGGYSQAMPGGKDPGKFPVKTPLKGPKKPEKPTNVSPVAMAPQQRRMMREQVERFQKLAGIKKKK